MKPAIRQIHPHRKHKTPLPQGRLMRMVMRHAFPEVFGDPAKTSTVVPIDRARRPAK